MIEKVQRGISTRNTSKQEIFGVYQTDDVEMQVSDTVATKTKRLSITIEEKDVALVSVHLPEEGIGYRTWKDDIFFSLCNNLWPSFICSFTCPCVPLIQMSNRVNFLPLEYSITGFATVITLSMVLLIFCKLDTFVFIWFFAFWVTWNVRNRVRNQDNLGGSNVLDCIFSFWCTPCTIAHNMRQLYQYESIIECDIGTCSPDGKPRRHSLRGTNVVPISNAHYDEEINQPNTALE